MSNVGIETAQNVVVHHEVATIGDRIVAYLIDLAILIAWIIVWFLILAFAGVNGVGFGVVAIVFIALPYMFYDLVCELMMDGQSIGKRVRHIKVARLDGGQPGLGQYLLRWVLRPIDGFYGLGLVVILINGKGQRLGDMAGGTTVVTLKQRVHLRDTLLTEVGPGHVVRFPEVVRLNDAQAAMIKEVLNNTQVGNRWALLEEMAAKVRKAIGNDGAGMKPLEFLQVVLRDYVHITGGQEGNGPASSSSSGPMVG